MDTLYFINTSQKETHMNNSARKHRLRKSFHRY